MIEELKKCMYRAIEHTEGCGGAVYYWCEQDNKQVNPFEDCQNCEEEE